MKTETKDRIGILVLGVFLGVAIMSAGQLLGGQSVKYEPEYTRVTYGECGGLEASYVRLENQLDDCWEDKSEALESQDKLMNFLWDENYLLKKACYNLTDDDVEFLNDMLRGVYY